MPNKEVYIKNYKSSLVNSSSLIFDGVNDFISLPNLGFAGNVDISVEGWIYINSFSSPSTIFSFSVEGTTRAGFIFQVNTAGLIQLGNWGNDANSAAGIIQLNQWYHVACTYEASTRRRIVYVNGIEVANSIAAANLNLTNASYAIGKRVANVDHFKGLVQDVRIWNVVRTQQQIQENMGKNLLGSEAGLLARYKINESSGVTAIDSKGSFNGTLTNFPANPRSDSIIAPIYQREYKGIAQYNFDSITSNINNGYGAVSFTLPRKFDDFGLGETTGLDGYEVEIVVYDQNQTSGEILFSGEVVKISRELGNKESVKIVALGPIFRLENTNLVTPLGSHIVTYTSLDLAEMFRQVIRCYNSVQFQNPITFNASSIVNTGVVRTISFNNATCLDALQTIFKATPIDYFWFLDSDKKTVSLKQIPSTPSHFFFMNKDIIQLSIDEDKLQINNSVAFWDGASNAREYKNRPSINKYGVFSSKKRDGRYATTQGMDNWGNRQVNSYGEPNLQVQIKVLDSSAGGYDLEAIKVGDTCRILNILKTAGLTDNMVITNKEDHLDYAVLTISDAFSYTSRELYALKKDQEQTNYVSGPSTYVQV